MLMEPDEYTSQERALTDKAKELIEQHELDWGNGECFIQRDAGHSELYMTLEAPNHATVTVTVTVWGVLHTWGVTPAAVQGSVAESLSC